MGPRTAQFLEEAFGFNKFLHPHTPKGRKGGGEWAETFRSDTEVGVTPAGQRFTLRIIGGGSRANPAGGKTALIAVDVQADFLPGGSLGVPHGNEVISPLVRRSKKVDLTVASGDWHPADHISFKAQGGPWPPHAVQGTPGAVINPRIERAANFVVHKGEKQDVDVYSAMSHDLANKLRQRGVTKVEVGGLATDYCVRATALDALKEGFKTTLLVDASRAVNVHPGDGARAIEEMRKAGAKIRHRRSHPSRL